MSLASALLTIAAENFRKEGKPEKARGLKSIASNMMGYRAYFSSVYDVRRLVRMV